MGGANNIDATAGALVTAVHKAVRNERLYFSAQAIDLETQRML